MAFRALHPILIAALLLASAAGARGLDRRLIHGYYNDGEFDRVIKSLADYGKTCKCTRDDSVFAEKHLAVVYAANPSTRELGRYHMFLMLDLAPGSDLLDMFVGEEVDAVFEKVRKEHNVRAVAQKPATNTKAPVPQAARAPRPVAARPAPRLGSEISPQAGAYSNPSNPANAAVPRPAPNPFAKSARTLLEGKVAAPVRVAGMQPQGVYATASVAPAINRSATATVSSMVPPAAPRPAAVNRPPAPGNAPEAARSRAFPLSAYVPKAAIPTAARTPAPALAVPPKTKVVQHSARPKAAVPLDASGKTPAESDDVKKPVWKEPGLWIGGGAALAVVAFTLFSGGGDEKPAASKTYVVPATASK